MDIICRKLANDMIYAYHAGRFWRWDDAQRTWKESHLMAAKFERARAALKTLTPEAFFSDGAEFALLDDYEIDSDMAEALKNAKPCKNAPIDPVKESPTLSVQYSGAATAAESQTAAFPAVQAASTPTTETAVAVQSSAALGSADESTPAPSNTAHSFDYSGLDAQTVDVLHMAEGQYAQGKKMTEVGLRWMVNAVSMAHDALCGGACATVVQAHNNQHSDDTFKAWCESIGISRSSAYNLLRVAEQFGSIEIDGKSILDVQPATLLYEAAKPSAPAELVQKVTAGEITSSAEYRAVLKENQQLRTDRVNAMNRAERAEHQLEAAYADIGGLQEQCAQMSQRANDAEEARIAARLQCQKAEAERDKAEERADSAEAREEEAWKMQSKAEARAKDAENQLAGSRQVAEAAKRHADKWRSEAEAARRQPIVAVVDKDEVARQAKEMADGMTADYKATQEQDARDAYDSIILAGRSITNLAQSIKPLFGKLPGEQRENAIDQFVRTLGQIQGEVSRCL